MGSEMCIRDSINEKDKNGNTALHIAAFYNSKEIAKLFSYGVNNNEKKIYGIRAFHYTVNSNYKNLIELFILHGARDL